MDKTNNQLEEKYQLGLYYRNGSSVDLAILIFEELATKYHAPSLLQMGLIYLNRETKNSKNPNLASLAPSETDSKAEFYFQIAAGLGDLESCYQLGALICAHDMYRISDAIPWLIMAADKGHTNAQLELGGLYEFRHKPQQAYQYYEKAAHSGQPSGKYHMAMLHFSNKVWPMGFEPKLFSFVPMIEQKRVENYKQGFKYLSQAAEEEHATAQYRLGLLLRDGLGEGTVKICNVNKALAQTLFEAAAKNGESRAKDILDGKEPYGHPRQGFG